MHRVILAALAAAAAIAPPALRAQEAASFADAVLAGRPILELRPRFNRIDESDKPERTQAWTYRAIVGWRSAPWHGLRWVAEAINTDHVGSKEFNDDGAQFATSEYPLLPDPRHTGVNQAYVEYAGLEGFKMRAGRQRVRLENQRWVSDNDFRQIPQLFDGVDVTATPLPATELEAGYYRRLRNTSGDTQDLRLTILRAAWNPASGHSLALYAVMHDQPVNGAFTGFANSSYRVAGARAEGAFRAGAFDIPYIAEIAQQKPYAGGDSRIDVDYWRLGAGAAFHDVLVRYDEERKGSNGGRYGLQMPLTDFYAFNGWTLHFFNTPFQGLRDRWVTFRAAHAPSTLTFFGEAHRFRSDFRDLDFGRETDVGLSWSFRESTVLRIQHARYDPGSGQVAPRIRKTWITLTYTY